jgi:hypothetical protein
MVGREIYNVFERTQKEELTDKELAERVIRRFNSHSDGDYMPKEGKVIEIAELLKSKDHLSSHVITSGHGIDGHRSKYSLTKELRGLLENGKARKH